MGYSSQQHGYRSLDVDERAHVCRHVCFHKILFPFVDKHSQFISSATYKNTCTTFPLFMPFSFQINSHDSYIPYPYFPTRTSPNMYATTPSSGVATHYPHDPPS